jgi:hypothetical protein
MEQKIINLKAFFAQKGISKHGVCLDADISDVTLNKILLRGETPSEKILEKLENACEKYGYKR